MANKALATRQRMQFRVEPSQQPRRPVAAAPAKGAARRQPAPPKTRAKPA
ncbi:hypothetical protein [Janthinobacterium fluminis]|uniref:Uncharacterized protein n=1 Tax=Janthinobacterium fluminis TaxID=2987524 RepID=A0ABT5K8P3_9BURK|nr:hypothetical protein [Janthinobacterium fluminis]MDC8760451.1 hypothetical protein [Janthinobacterium fluminis]